MDSESLVECAFLIPMRRDALLSDGLLHAPEDTYWLQNELFLRFQGGTQAPGIYQGFYADPDTGQQVHDRSRRYIVAVPRSRLDELRQLLTECCVRFAQKAIYLSIAGNVEFISPP